MLDEKRKHVGRGKVKLVTPSPFDNHLRSMFHGLSHIDFGNGSKPIVVTIGGGTGASMVGEGLARYERIFPIIITTGSDNGGNTGDLRDRHGILPAGDLGRGVIALIPDGERAHIWRRVLATRIPKNEGGLLAGHVGRNLFYLFFEKAFEREGTKLGRAEAVLAFQKALEVRGEVIPVTLEDTDLWAELVDEYGNVEILQGETSIDTRDPTDPRSIGRVGLSPKPAPNERMFEALRQAVVINIGPGSLRSSIDAVMSVEGVVEGINSSKALLTVKTNLMNEPRETRDYDVGDFVEALYDCGITRKAIIFVNKARLPKRLLADYTRKDQYPMLFNKRAARKLQGRAQEVIFTDCVSREGFQEGLIRHDPHKVAAVLMAHLARKRKIKVGVPT